MVELPDRTSKAAVMKNDPKSKALPEISEKTKTEKKKQKIWRTKQKFQNKKYSSYRLKNSLDGLNSGIEIKNEWTWGRGKLSKFGKREKPNARSSINSCKDQLKEIHTQTHHTQTTEN